MKQITILVALVFTLLFSACSDSDSNSTPAVVLEKIEVTPPYVKLDIGTTQIFKAYGFYSDETQEDITDKVYWSFEQDNGTLQSVDNSLSYVQALKIGNETLIATLSDKNSSADIVVSESSLVSLQIDPTEAEITVKYSREFSVEGTYSDNHTQDLTQEANWTTGDESIAKIRKATDDTVWVDGIDEGQTTVEVSYEGISSIAEVTTYAENKIESIRVEPSSWSAIEGDSKYFTAFALYTDGKEDLISDKDMHYRLKSNDDYGIVKIDDKKNYVVHAISEGNATVEAYLNISLKVDIPIKVSKLEIERIATSPSEYTLEVGKQQQYFTDYVLNNGPQRITLSNWNKDLTYHSSNSEIASISDIDGKRGLLTGRSAGVATITSTFNYEGKVYESNATITITQE